MIATGSLEYALARMAARVRARPSEFEWRRIEVVRDGPALLETARAIEAFAPWLAPNAAEGDAHAIEAHFRARWRLVVGEAARWMPGEWTSAIEWCAIVPELPALAHIARGAARPAWMAQDVALASLLDAGPARGARDALARSAFAPLALGWSAPERLVEAWVSEWHARLPAMGDDDRRAFAALRHDLARHGALFAASAVRDGWPLRRSLGLALESRYHRSVGSPAAAFAWLALVALDAERLRGEVVRRTAFPRLTLAA